MKITIDQLKEVLNSSLSMAEAASKLPINFKTFRTYCKKHDLYLTNQSGKGISKLKPKIPLEDILTNIHIGYSSHSLKNRLILEKGWLHVCSVCKLSDWLDQKIPLELDHIDGNHFNNEEKNLRFLCPNCHAQTPTYRNKKRI